MGIFLVKTNFIVTLNKKVLLMKNIKKTKYLSTTLNVKTLNHMNNLYNAQEIIESRFQLIQEKFSFSPRKRNTASMLSGCVQKNKSMSIIALPTSCMYGVH